MMTKEEFRQAIRDAMDESIERDLAAYKEKYGDEPHVFSAEHGAKMRAIFDNFEKRQRRRRRARWALVTAACAVVVLTCVSCTVPQIKESISGFFVQVFGDHVEYTDPAVTKECIEEEYDLVPVPEGFEITEETETDTSRTVTYTDKENNVIILNQIASKSNASNVDNEHGTLIEAVIGDNIVMLYMGEGSAQASWIQEGYYFSLSYNAQIDRTLFEEWIASVEKL